MGKKKKDKKDKNKKNKNKNKGKNKKNLIFGIDPMLLSSTLILNKDYISPIPNVLVKLKKELFLNNGHLIEGIFRIAPNQEECKVVEDDLNNGKLKDINFSIIDGDLIANLIKLWFRELPNPVLQELLNGNKIENAKSIDKVQGVVDGVNEPYKSYFIWLLDLCLDIIQHGATNKMSVKAMAVVMAPNLYDPSKIQNPVKIMSFSAAIVKFMMFAIQWRQNKIQ